MQITRNPRAFKKAMTSRQPCGLFVGQIREDLDLAQIID